MRSIFWLLCMIALNVSCLAAEKTFNFSESLDKTPAGFRSTVSGQGKRGNWKVILEDAPSAFQSLGPESTATVTKKPVLAQLSEEALDEHFPLLIYDGDVFGDFTFTTKFKTVKGVMEQMAGLAFRIQDETNYYVVRASSLGNTFRFYKVVNGERGKIIGPEIKIEKNTWHEMTVDCKGNQIRCLLDGKEAMPAITDNTFSFGKIGFWTKSDSVSYFADPKIVYTPRERFVQKLLNDVFKRNSKLLGLKIFATVGSAKPKVIAGIRSEDLGQLAGKTEEIVLEKGEVSFQKTKTSVIVTWPLRDRNGDPIAALQVTMKTFPGEMEQTSIVRGLPIKKEIESSIQDVKDLTR
jgi:hypothetical protein